MTKRDVAVWFCKVVGLAVVVMTVFDGLSVFIAWKLRGEVEILWLIPNFALYLFLYLFAQGIGTEIAAEGEHGEPITSSADLGILFLRGIGLCLFLGGASVSSSAFLEFASGYFPPLTMPSDTSYLWPDVISGSLESTIGFVLAFGPRLRAAMRSN